MIALSSTAAAAYAYLAAPPTHAVLIACSVAFIDATGHYDMVATYNLGNVDNTGTFTPHAHAQSVVLSLPTRFDPSKRAQESAMVANLLATGAAPDPANPGNTIAVPAKKKNDWKIADVDAIAAYYHPKLGGTLV